MEELDQVTEVQDVEPETGMFEPQKYFELLKGKITETEQKDIETSLTIVRQEYEQALALGQKTLTNTIAKLHETLEKEAVLHSLGIRRVIEHSLVEEFIDKVEPKDSVKVVELEFYPRNIPATNAADIARVKELGLFDEIVIVYTDFTKEPVKTREHQAMVARNRDPIAFGIFHNATIGFNHDRMYVITDWEDEFCDLTFSRMVSKMGGMGMKVDEKETYLRKMTPAEISKHVKTNMEEINRKASEVLYREPPEVKSIFGRIWDKIRK